MKRLIECFKGEFFQKLCYVNDACHIVRFDRFFDLAVFQQESQRFIFIDIAFDPVDHREMSRDKVP